MFFLKFLNLSSNRFESIEPELFSDLSDLATLDMSNNSIKQITAISGLSRLQNLYFHMNPVETFPRLHSLFSIARVHTPARLFDKFSNLANLIGSLKRTRSSKSSNSIIYFKSVSVFYAGAERQIVYESDRDCFNVIYLIRHRIILNFQSDNDLDVFMSLCKTYIATIFRK